jgi:predicted transcriptional regulator of viral defense system
MNSITRLKKIRASAFSLADANRVGVSARMLTYLVGRGELKRKAHGVYCFPDFIDEVDLVGILRETLQLVPNAIVGLETALQLYDLSDEPTQAIHLIVHQSKIPSRDLPNVRLFRVRSPLCALKTTKLHGIRVTTLEQTMVDLLRTGQPISELVRIFHAAQRRKIPLELSTLQRLGERFRAKGRVTRFIEAVC